MVHTLGAVKTPGVSKAHPLPVLGSPAESRGAFVVVLAVRAKRFAVHDPPQGRHPGCPPLRVRPVRLGYRVRTGRNQGAGARLVRYKRSVLTFDL